MILHVYNTHFVRFSTFMILCASRKLELRVIHFLKSLIYGDNYLTSRNPQKGKRLSVPILYKNISTVYCTQTKYSFFKNQYQLFVLFEQRLLQFQSNYEVHTHKIECNQFHSLRFSCTFHLLCWEIMESIKQW